MGQETTKNCAVLSDITGVGPATARTLAEHGFADVRSVAAAEVAHLAQTPGFGGVRAAAVKASAEALIGPEPDAAAIGSEASRKSKKRKKSRKNRKSKKRKKSEKNRKSKKRKKSRKSKKSKKGKKRS